MDTKRILIIPHIHWDREWYAPFQQSRFHLMRMIDRLIECLTGDMHYPAIELDGQTALIQDYLQAAPTNAFSVRQLIKERRLLVGPWYVPPDEFLVSGEAIVRNLLLGTRIASEMGILRTVAYLGDTAGHISEMPQLLAGFGIRAFVFSRGLGGIGESLGQIFNWLSADGSSVIAINLIGGFSNARALGYIPEKLVNVEEYELDLAEAARVARDILSKQEPYMRCGVYVFAARDPGPHLPLIIDHLRKTLPEMDRIEASTFEELAAIAGSCAGELAVYQGEMNEGRYAAIMPGKLSTRIWIKQTNRVVQDLLERWIEPFSAVSWCYGLGFRQGVLHLAWEMLLQNQSHDSIYGCFTDESEAEVAQRFRSVLQVGEIYLEEILEEIARNTVTESLLPNSNFDGAVPAILPLVVFNASPFKRTEVVECDVSLPISWGCNAKLELINNNGLRVEFAIIQRSLRREREDLRLPLREVVQIVFSADVPPLGFNVYALRVDKLENHTLLIQQNTNERTIENMYYRITAAEDGTIVTVDKRSGKEFRGLFEFQDEADLGDCYSSFCPRDQDAWTTRGKPVEVRCTNDGNIRRQLKLIYDWQLPIGLTETMTRDKKTRRFPIVLTIYLGEHDKCARLMVEIENTVRDHRLRVLVPTGIRTDVVDVAGHFGINSRPVTFTTTEASKWVEMPAATQPHHGFIDVSDGNQGIAILAPGLPEYEAIKATDGTIKIALTLIRSIGWLSRDRVEGRRVPVGPCVPTNGAQCLGNQKFSFAIFPHRGSWEESGVVFEAECFRLPLRVLQHRKGPLLRQFKMSWRSESVADEYTAIHAGTLPLSMSFLEIKGDSVVISALKVAELQNGLVVRLFSPRHTGTTVHLVFGPSIDSAAYARLDEEEIDMGIIPIIDQKHMSFEIPKHQIVTVKCKPFCFSDSHDETEDAASHILSKTHCDQDRH